MIKNKLLTLVIVSLFLFGCITPPESKQTNTRVHNNLSIPEQEHSIKSALWQQTSAEYRALTYQAFNLAKLQLDKELGIRLEGENPLAIITDIDETILDNSPFSGKMIELDEGYSKDKWIEWGKQKSAVSVPGSLEFLVYAASKNVEVFYISNRYIEQLDETLENMKTIGFPFATKDHILLKETTSEKEPRRNKIQKDYKIIMLLGDNLSDFSNVFDDNSTKRRNVLADSLKADFGRKFIVLPNPMYGDWEVDGLYEGSYDWTPKEKDSIRHAKLISY
jgi:5'-nucleotidase (lipoprotein e(P4) family)